MLDPRLIKKINRGNCFALVGSGPSSEIGYPSWATLAELTYKEAAGHTKTVDDAGYRKFLLQKDFPAVFELAESDLGGRTQLISFLKGHLQPSRSVANGVYDFLIRWPFACYLTTNWDDELPRRLQAAGHYFSTVQNTVDDFAKIREGVRKLVVKIHSDLEHPTEAVITTSDYARYHVGSSFDYFRKKIRSLVEMFDVLIVGHSLADADLKYILQTARELGSPDHPIFMITADATDAERAQYLKQFNILITSYDNSDGTHSGLRRILAGTTHFVRDRSEEARPEQYDVPAEEVEAASSLFLYMRLQRVADETKSAHSSVLEPIALQALADGDIGLTRDELAAHRLLEPLLSGAASAADEVNVTVSALVTRNLASMAGSKIVISKAGRAALTKIRAARQLESQQAYGEFRLAIQQSVPGAGDDVASRCEALLRECVVGLFRRRGMAIANAVFASQPARGDDLSDIFGVLADAANTLPSAEVGAAFVDAAHKFLVSPSPEQRDYLASISQGFFLYHLIGKDPATTSVRQKLFENTVWLIDSSLLIPFSAVGCSEHDYSVDLFKRLQAVGATYYTTTGLLREVVEHFDWARNFASSHQIYTAEFLTAALARSNFKQNLFLDGFVGTVATGKVSTFSEYSRLLFPSGANYVSIKEALLANGVEVLDLDELEGFDQLDYGELIGINEAIRVERQKRHSLRKESQVQAEAEVYQMVRRLADGTLRIKEQLEKPSRVYFVSHSNVLDSLSPGAIITWGPEPLYRYLTSLPSGDAVDPALLQQCMLNDYYSLGISFVDTAKYERFFLPYITAAKAQFHEQKERYLQYVEDIHGLNEAFERTADLEKPLFVEQMLARTARIDAQRAESATKRAEEAEARVRALEAEREAAWKKRAAIREAQEVAEKKHKQDPAFVRKKQKQSAKRARKRKRKS